MFYVIAGDTKYHKNCLIYTVGASKERAEEVLKRILTEPNENDLVSCAGHYNLRVEAVERKNAWWLDGGLD